ncbi:hypothetical protein SAMN06265171_108128 [Chryseobacterium rhizoplanae]|uniref:Uncharacterized protein n=1 Tax=Chryseobacterium rhizoplanae TaxID=1609531 RepID=A0A521EIY1_9FLAO|nr:hypothetical protein [Chryseobacterium rhizoplanae]SMO83868.1 hypothetical protein SAMN06265171_108128 [Chryseobacterium rhizoplanae]
MKIFLGSLIGIILTNIFNRLSIANKLNNYRKLILKYNDEIALPKSTAYISDFDKTKFYILNYYSIVFEKNNFNGKSQRTYDTMPMFNSEIYKSIPSEYLFRLFTVRNDYSKFIDIIYSIDYLKENSPLNISTDFTEQVKQHISYKNLKPEETTEHFKNCSFLEENTDLYISKITNYTKRANSLKKELNDINSNLNGHSVYWLFRYVFN